MDVLIDTNVIIDLAQEREPFVHAANELLNLEALELHMTASAVTDIYYLQKKYAGDANARLFLSYMLGAFKIVDVMEADCRRALMLPMPDYEDALQAVCARRAKCGYIITRNERHYENSPVPAICPEQFLKEWTSHAKP